LIRVEQFFLVPTRYLFMRNKNHINTVKKNVALVAILMLTVCLYGYFVPGSKGNIFYEPLVKSTDSRLISNTEVLNRLKEKASQAKFFVDENGFDVSYCFMVDMRLPSGKNRFFVYNLLKDSLEAAGLVTHGKGSQNETGDLIFSNMPNSNCTSLGKYKIGSSYNGNFGLSYKLMGLDKTNSKALDRAVVLHSYLGVPNTEVYPASICVSEGCPAVSAPFFAQLKGYMEESQEPILLWIYY
jgi:L,D-transpeptidase catalytic domain